MKNITLNSLLLHDWQSIANSIWIDQESLEGFELPPQRIARYALNGRHGSKKADQKYDGRFIGMNGGIYNGNYNAYEQARRNLINELGIKKDNFNNLIPSTLYFTTRDDIALQMECTVKKFSMLKPKIPYVPFRLELESDDYRFYSQTLKTETLNVVQDGGNIIPGLIPNIIEAPTQLFSILNNAGTEDTHPIITFNGPLLNPILFNIFTSTILYLKAEIPQGDFIEIDCYKETVLYNGTQNAYDLLDYTSRFGWLLPGDNYMYLLNSGGTGSIVFSWRDAFLGV